MDVGRSFRLKVGSACRETLDNKQSARQWSRGKADSNL